MKKLILGITILISFGSDAQRKDEFKPVTESMIIESIDYRVSLCPKCGEDRFEIYFGDFKFIVVIDQDKEIFYAIETWENKNIDIKKFSEETKCRIIEFINYKTQR